MTINNDKLLDALIKCIQSDSYLNNKYYTNWRTKKYDIRTLISIILEILRLGITWRQVNKLVIAKDIHCWWNTHQYIKLVSNWWKIILSRSALMIRLRNI